MASTGISDIDVALRYTQQGESIDFGFLGALESDAEFSEGRQFYALRGVKNGESYSVGYLGTLADRPFFDRTATVHSVDWLYRPSETVRLSAVGMRSDVDEAIDDLDSSGHGVKIDVSLTPNRDRWHYIGGYYFDADLDIRHGVPSG